jgi:hypothetical protein
MPNFLTLKTLKTFIISFIGLTDGDGSGTSNFGVDFTQLWRHLLLLCKKRNFHLETKITRWHFSLIFWQKM